MQERKFGSQLHVNASVVARRTSLDLPVDLPLDRWRSLGAHIAVIADSSSWWLGDWLIYGQAHYPDRYKIALADTSLSYQTLRNYAWVAGRFGVARRRGRLSFQHHAEVAGLDERAQDHWLEQAERHGWSRNELRRHIRESLRAPERRPVGEAARPGPELGSGTASGSGDTQAAIRFKITTERRIRWQKAAANQGQALAEWIVSVLDRCAPATVRPATESCTADLPHHPVLAGRALEECGAAHARCGPLEPAAPQP
ncbi:LmbU family transcriptional regulator [Streptomyces flavofungini]|uniref:LmbU family transcriptional regulator n=1 Tax=Streptomyces flavofungini TaxID=68200 RepID=UPI001E2F9D72|nr:LmbU family transcriptional regulator [Streptomyces flavofungini]